MRRIVLILLALVVSSVSSAQVLPGYFNPLTLSNDPLNPTTVIDIAPGATSETINDSDRGKLITASNTAAQAYTIAQAGAASNFQGGWFTDIANIGTAVAGIVTVTPTTSTICGATSVKVYPGQSLRIVSDGTNYQCPARIPSGGPVLLNTLVASSSASLSDTTSLTGVYNEYRIVFENIVPATNATSCEIVVHESGTFPVRAIRPPTPERQQGHSPVPARPPISPVRS